MTKAVKALGMTVALAVLGGAGYALVNPAFATTCRNTCAAGLEWTRSQALNLHDAFKRSSLHASYAKALRTHKSRAEERKKTKPKAAPPPKPLDMSPAAVLKRELDNLSTGQKIARGTDAAQRKKLGFTTQDLLASHIDRVIGYASSSTTKRMSGGRTIYWDERTRCCILIDPHTPSGGSMFKPEQGYPYFRDITSLPETP